MFSIVLGWFTGGLSKLWPYIAIAGLLALSLASATARGALKNEVKNLKGVNDAQRKIRKATAETRTDRDSVSKRMRDGDF
tara:strand:+ start:265 stop:504 length:240 start_codon:yes stop_codon:yes gene_type:complete